MKKIIFINRFFYPDISATSQLLTDLALYTQANGYQVSILSSRISSSPKNSSYSAFETLDGINIYRLWTTRLGHFHLIGKFIDYLTFYINLLPALFKHISAGDIVVVKTDPPLISVLATPVALKKKAKVICWQQDIFPEVAIHVGLISKKNPILKALKRVRNFYLKRTDKIVVLSDLMKSYLEDSGIDKDKLQIIHNWADGEAITPIKQEDNPLRKKLDIKNRIIVGYSGNLGRAHEYHSILNAMIQLKSDNSIAFLIIGGGVNNLKLKELVKEKNLDNIHFMDYLPFDKLSLGLGCIDIHLTSLQTSLEPFIVPSKLYGILASGRPIIHIGDNQGTIATILSKYQCGLIVASNDNIGLIKSIYHLHKDKNTRRVMGENARGAYDDKYNKTNSLTAWLSCVCHMDK